MTLPPPEELRRRYSDEALRAIPKLLTLVDRNRYSPTYGSFDRSYWHYRTMDFPCGMSQEFVLPLALVHAHPFPDNPYRGSERVREIALAGVDFARRSSHADGSCDDYFPYEQALGALVFSLYAMTEACLILGVRRDEFVEFFARRGSWLLAHNESGQLTNHQALAALALHNVGEMTGDRKFAEGRDEYLKIVESWQSDEGWFQEYEGADPGYHSCSIAYLGKLLKKLPADSEPARRIEKTLHPAVDFAWHFMHPDGSYAGEYGSRNTYHFFPHGFEAMAGKNERALQVANHFLTRSIPNGTRYYNDDDRMCAHYVYDWLQAWLDFHPDRAAPDLNDRPNFARAFPKAGLLVKKTDRYYAVVAANKGCVAKVCDEGGAIASDAGVVAATEDGRVVASHFVLDADGAKIEVAENGDARVEGAGPLCFRKTKLASPFKLILFRCLNLTFGRFAPNLLRTILQKILITGKPASECSFRRIATLTDDAIRVETEIVVPPNAPRLVGAHVASDATSIYVANSNVYQRSVLIPWRDRTDRLGDGRGTIRWTDELVPGRDEGRGSLAKNAEVELR